jgi:hypothetical protein
MNIEIDKFETEQIPLEEEIKKEENEQTKKRRGRPRKNTIEEENNTQVKINFSFLYEIIVERLPNKKPLSESEKDSLNEVTNKLAEKYLPMVAGYDIEISFLLVVSSVLIPRLQKTKNEQNETIEETESNENEKA